MESNNYNFNVDQDKLSSKQIEKHMDFDALFAKFEAAKSEDSALIVPLENKKKSNLRIIRRAAALAGAAVIAGLYFFFSTPTQSNSIQKDYFASKDYINPPFDDVQAKFASYKVNADQGGNFDYNTKSKVVVPAAAFTDKNGKTVTGDVDIKYREYQDFVDFFLSGIPMVYDSADQQYLLESAGMIEIYAEQDGERLNVSPGKSIAIELYSEINIKNDERPQYNIYSLDIEARNWKYEGLDNIEVLGVKTDQNNGTQAERALETQFKARFEDIKNQRDRELKALEASIPMPAAPQRPKRHNGTDTVFDFDFSELDFSSNLESAADMQELSNMSWQPVPGTTLSEEDAAITWEDYKMVQMDERTFELSLIKGNKTLKIKVNPVLTGEAFDKALVTFNSKLSKFETLKAQRSAKIQPEIDAIKADYTRKNEVLSKRLADEKVKLNQTPSAKMVKSKIINRFNATRLGIWNCDRPIPNDAVNLKARFIDDKEKIHESNVAFLVDKNKNTIKRHFTKDGEQLNFDNTTDNLLWIVTADKKIAVFRPEEFKMINKKKGDHTFRMKVIDKEIQSETDVRKILHF